MPKIVGVTKARQKLANIINQANEHGEPIYLTNFNEPQAVLIGYQAFEDLLSRMDDLEDILAVYQGREEPTRPFEEAWIEIEQEAEARDHEQISLATDSVG